MSFDLKGILVPVLELIGVLALAILLVCGLVTCLLALLRRLLGRALFPSYKLLLALRFLLGYRETHKGLLSRLVPVSSQHFIAMVGTAIGVWALIVVLSVMGGFEEDLKSKIVRHRPHITVIARDPSARERTLALPATLASIPHVLVAEAYFEGEAMLMSSVNMMPSVLIYGVKPEGRLSEIWLREGSDPVTPETLKEPVLAMSDRELGFRTKDSADYSRRPSEEPLEGMPRITTSRRGPRVLPTIALGRELADSLSVAQGDSVNVVIPDGEVGPTGLRPRIKRLRVAGTFETGMYEYDLKSAYMDLEASERLFLADGPNRVAVILDDVDNLEKVLPAVKEAAEGLEVVTVAETNKALFSAMRVEKVAMFLVLGLVILVAAFNIFSSLILITLEKTRDIAVVRSLGGTRGGVRSVFLILGGVIGLIGALAGLILGLGTCAYIRLTGIRLPAEYYLRTLPVTVRPDEVLLVVLAALAAALVATLYPARSAASLEPAQGLRND